MYLQPFFTYYGGKWRSAKHYPQPQHQLIVEPFAGAAGYSLRYPHHQVTLCEVDPKVFGVWHYLKHVSAAEVRALPINVGHVDDLHVCQEAAWLIGFWLNKGTTQPSLSPSKWMRTYQATQPGTYWGPTIRERIASQVDSIRHWTITNASFETIPDCKATWFIDPPYEVAGRHYKFHDIDYPSLSDWCRSRSGQVIVCENAGADWLGFQPFRTIKGLEGKRGGKKSVEVLWTSNTRPVGTGCEHSCDIDINSEVVRLTDEQPMTL